MIMAIGKHIGIRDIKDQQGNSMKFIRQAESIKEITAMRLSPNNRFLAVCERHKNDPNAYISFYDMKSAGFKHIKQSINMTELITPFPTSGPA